MLPFMAPESSRSGSVAVAAAACLWGTWGILVRVAGTSGAASACIALGTIGIAGMPLLPRKRVARGAAIWVALAAIGVCDGANALLFFGALQRGPVGVAVLSHYVAPVLVALLSPLALGAWPRRATFVALAVSLAGLALLLGREILLVGHSMVTALFGAGSAVFFAVNIILSKRISDRVEPAELLVYHALVSALVVLPFALAGPVPSLRGALVVTGGAVVSGIGGGMLFLWGLGRIPASRAGVLSYLEPVVAVISAALILGETMAPLAPLGAALIIGAGLLVVRYG